MKGKLNYKSKRTLIVASVIVVLFLLAVIGTISFMKGNKSADAATVDNNVTANQTVEGEENSSNNNEENLNEDEENSEDENAEQNTNDDLENNDNAIDGTENNNDIAGNTENNDTTGNATTQTGTINSSITNNGATTGNAEGDGQVATGTTGTTTTTDSEDVPNTEYTQTGEEVEKKVSDSFYVSWTPIDVKAITEQINKPELEIHKMSFINNETKNDQEIHSAVVEKDYITYTISVRNNSDVDVNNVHIYDSVPEGTEFVAIFDDGEIKKDKLTWVKDVKAREEITVSFRVRVILEKDAEGKEITQIDNTAIVNGEETETTHNPIILAEKQVKVIAEDENGNLKELENQAVIPGSRLRYYIVLTNTSEYDGTTKVTDQIPEGTSLIDGTISEGGELDESNVITWKNVNVPAGETVKVYFDITVNKGRRETVSNVARIGTDRPTDPTKPTDPENPTDPEEPTEPDDPQYTNEVRTPVLKAFKTSEKDGEEVHETNIIDYKITIVNVGNPEIEEENVPGTAKLVDKFWNGEEGQLGDNAKVKFVEGSIKINGEKTDKTEDFLKNIEVTLNAGETVTIEYQYKVKEMTADVAEGKISYTIPDEGTIEDIIRNNLYWKTPEPGDPTRPENPNDTTDYQNPKDPTDPEDPREDDPTPPEKDPNDNDTTNKDPESPIDTVKVTVKEEYIKKEATKTWDDYTNMYETRPTEVIFTLFKNGEVHKKADGEDNKITLTVDNKVDDNNWKVEFKQLKKTDADGKDYVYTINEDKVDENYTKIINEEGEELKITNQYVNPEINAVKHVEIVKENGETDQNQAVVPGTRLRYTIKLTNKTDVDAYKNVTDEVPEGTTLYKDIISQDFFIGKEEQDGKVTLKWEKVKVPAHDSVELSFDVTVNNNTRETVENAAVITDPNNPEESQETNKVETPVIIARKKSVIYDGTKATEKNKITYLVEVVATNVSSENTEILKQATVRLIDEFWINDTSKVTYVEGSLVTTKNVVKKSSEEATIKNIEVKLNAGDKATIEYKYELNKLPEDIEVTTIKNNLYWAKPTVEDPSRPTDSGDNTKYENPNPDTENQFKNEELKNYVDPTDPEVDQEYVDKLNKDEKEDTSKDPTKPIDTVVVEVNSIKGVKKVNTIAVDENGNLKELDNQSVVPGTRLRYTITLTNNTDITGTTNITDTIPEGTALINGTITDGGELKNNVITWKDIEVEAHQTKNVSFDVTVKNSTRDTISNIAKIGTDPNPENQTETNKVQTPVIIARKKSKDFDGKSVKAGDEITYLVEIVATDVDDKYEDTVKVAIAKLVDKFWTGDDSKVEFVSGNIKINNETYKENASKEEVENISVPLNAGDKATIEYKFKIKELTGDNYIDTIENNLYWAKPTVEDPSRPTNPNDKTEYENPNPDTDNEFRNEDLKDYKDPTDPEVDKEDEDKTTKDPSKPIDTVKVEVVKYTEIPITKVWKNDDDKKAEQRPSEITVKLYGRDKKNPVETATIKPEDKNVNEWKHTFRDLLVGDEQGKIDYSIEEIQINNYKTEVKEENGGFTITNTYAQDITGTIRVTNVENQTVPMDVVFVLDISGSMLNNASENRNYDDNKAHDMVNAVNAAITKIRQNPKNRVAIELFHSGTTDLLDLGYHDPKTPGQYITYSKYTQSGITRGKITLNVKNKSNTSGTVYNDIYGADNYYVGTYTQGGINEARKLLTKPSNGTTAKLDNGKTVNRVPVMILVTDGDPTHYDTNIENPMTPDIANGVYAPTTHDVGLPGVGILRFNTSKYYEYTMKTIISAKQNIANTYKQDCYFYTIGIHMKGSMANALLDPFNSETNINNIDKLNRDYDKTAESDINYEVNGNNKNYATDSTHKKAAKEYYVNQQLALYKAVKNIEDYTDASFTNNMTEANMKAAFDKIIQLSSQTESDITPLQSKERKVELTDIDVNKKFIIKVTNGVDRNGKKVTTIDKTFDTFTAARSTYSSKDGVVYISETTIDLRNLASGTVEITYQKK